MSHFPFALAGIIFDCDGVMINSEAANRHFYNKILDAFHLPHMTPEQESYAFMATSRQALESMIPLSMHDRIEPVVRDVIDYDRDILPITRLMPGFREFVEKAHAAGLKLAIDTNRTAEGIQRILDFFELPNYFNPVISASCALPKPSPDGALKIYNAWGAAAARVLFVGDSVDDRRAAVDAGMKFAGFGPHGPAGDLNILNYRELEQAILPASQTV